MTPETRKKALAKLDAFGTGKVGYPDQWKDYGTVEIRRDDYFGNSRRARVFEVKREQARIDKPTDRTLWGMTPPTVNAYYNAANNEIVFPAGILQPPFFDRGADDAVNFGGIGVVIGHEFTHGFDDQGSKFDAAGQPLELVDGRTTARRSRSAPTASRGSTSGYVAVNDPANGDVHLNGQAHPRREHRRQRRPAGRLRGPPEGARRQARGDDRRLHARAALLPRLRQRLVPERHRGGGPPARPDRLPLAGRVPRDRLRRQHARVRRGLRLQGGPADGAGERLPGLVRGRPGATPAVRRAPARCAGPAPATGSRRPRRWRSRSGGRRRRAGWPPGRRRSRRCP